MTDQNKKLVITSSLPYVNNTPHLGNVVGCVLSADVYARYTRTVKGRDVLFIGGVDEYGTATEMKARELSISCKEL
jgi:methionyl-tRNA synthetase